MAIPMRIFVAVLNVSDVPPCSIVGFSEVEILVRFNTLWPSKGYQLVLIPPDLVVEPAPATGLSDPRTSNSYYPVLLLPPSDHP